MIVKKHKKRGTKNKITCLSGGMGVVRKTTLLSFGGTKNDGIEDTILSFESTKSGCVWDIFLSLRVS